jgi:hypothetical protein
MHLVPRQLPAAIFSFAILLLGGLVVVAPPASAGDSSLPADYYICHATGNAATVEDVANWSSQSPNSEGVLSGHVGAGHQNGNDIIPPIPGVLSAGQNWTSYGQQVHANGCSVPRPAQPAAETRSVPGREESCATGGVTSWVDVYTRPYVWSDAEHGWALGAESGPVRTDETFVAFSDEEYLAACADAQPSAETRSVPQSEASCDPAGVTTWTDVYTTEYVWNSETRTWELSEESGPVRTDETFVPYTDAELAEHCPDGKGDDDKGDDDKGDDDKGDDKGDHGQSPNPGGQSPNHGAQDDDDADNADKGSDAGSGAPATAATAAVPTVVDAGLGADLPPASNRTPMCLLALGGGIGLMGAAGLRRRATAHR